MCTRANFLKPYLQITPSLTVQEADFTHEQITIPKISRFVRKLQRLRSSPTEIEVVSDFDYTLTKYRHNNKQCDSLFGMWTKSDAIPDSFKSDLISSYQEFGPYETDGSISFEDRTFLINQLYVLQTKLFQNHNITHDMFSQVLRDSNLIFRSHTQQLLHTLHKFAIPLYIISGGISDSIYNSLLPLAELTHISIHSNELETYPPLLQQPQDLSSPLIRFRPEIVHSYNKYKVMNHMDKKKHCILMGDLVSDIYMAEGNEYDTVFSVFYAKEGENDQRALAETKFDIIVEGDNSHRIIVELLKVIVGGGEGVDWKYLYQSHHCLHQLLI